jgi:hypothetical protein
LTGHNSAAKPHEQISSRDADFKPLDLRDAAKPRTQTPIDATLDARHGLSPLQKGLATA